MNYYLLQRTVRTCYLFLQK